MNTFDEFCLRKSHLAMLWKFDCVPGYEHAHHGTFPQNTVVATTNGRWHFRSSNAKTAVEPSSLVVGNSGDTFEWYNMAGRDTNTFAVTLFPHSLEEDLTLFTKRIVDSESLRRLFLHALHAKTDDDFDSAVFTIFSEAASRSMEEQHIIARVRVERAKRFIEQHAFEPLALRHVADEIGMSPFTTIRQFRAFAGRTPHAYLLDIRLEAAKALLVKTNDSIESIAKRVGFADLPHFSRFFKQRTGSAPSRFRAA